MEWFKEEWLSSDSKALGIYMALLLLLRYSKEKSKQKVSEEIGKVVKGEERSEAWEVVNEFIETFDSLYHNNSEEGRKALEELEKKYYERLKKACYKYLNKNIIEKYKKYGKYITNVLRIIRIRYHSRASTSCGSVFIRGIITLDLVSEILTGRFYDSLFREEMEYVNAVYNFLSESGIKWEGFIPAPYLEDEFLEKLEKGEEIIIEDGKKQSLKE